MRVLGWHVFGGMMLVEAVVLLGACERPMPAVGISNRVQDHGSDASVSLDAGMSGPSALDRFRADLHSLGPATRSQGHYLGAVQVEIRGNAAGDATLSTRSHAVELNSKLLAIHTNLKGEPTGAPFGMERVSGDAGALAWRFVVFGDDGAIVQEGAKTKACADCHAEAERDSVFPISRSR